MAGITALGTTYSLPNYGGALFMLTPVDTPFFSAIGGLNAGGGQTTDYEFEWQTEDLRSPGQNTALEGQDAPTDQNRVRAVAKNVCQIQQETVGVSYTKRAATGRKSGLANFQGNPILDELDHQSTLMLIQMVRDIEWSFVNGLYQLPSDNTTARKTRGILAAIATNVFDASVAIPGGTATTATASTDLIAATAHGLAADDQVVFTSVGTATPLALNTVYYATTVTANSFAVSLTRGGAVVNITADGTVTVRKRRALTKAMVDGIQQMSYDNGGLQEGEAATLMVPSAQGLALTAAYTAAGYVTKPLEANVGGVHVQRVDTDFGPMNRMLNRHLPSDTVTVLSLEQCQPVYLDIPGKGHFFQEPLAKTGAKDRNQLYGEVGLAYGNERTHAKITNLALPAPA